MIRLLILVLLLFLAYTVWSLAFKSLPRGRNLPPEKSRRGEDMVQDPQCGTYVPLGDAVTGNRKGKTHYFCSKKCRDAFLGGG